MKKRKRVTPRRLQKKISRPRAAAGGSKRPLAPMPVWQRLQADQEADYAASRRRRSGLVPKTGAGLPDEDQSGAAELDDGKEKKLALAAPGLESRQNWANPASLLRDADWIRGVRGTLNSGPTLQNPPTGPEYFSRGFRK